MIPIARARHTTLSLTAFAVTLIAVMTAFLLWQLRVREQRHADEETLSLSKVVAEHSARSLQSIDLALDVALHHIRQARQRGAPISDASIHSMLVARIEGMPQLRSIFVTNADGTIESSALSYPAPTFSVADRDYFLQLRDRPQLGRYVSTPVTNRLDGKRTVFFSRRVGNPEDRFSGIVAASLDIAYIESLFDSIEMGSVGVIALYLTDGTLVARRPRDTSLIDRQVALPAVDHGWAGDHQSLSERTDGADASFTAYRKVSGFPMVLAITMRDRDSLEGWRGTARMVSILALTNILLVLWVTAFLLRRQRREEKLVAVARESDEHMRAMVNTTMDAIVTIDREQRILVFNPAAEKMFGYRADEVLGNRLDRLLPERFRLLHGVDVAGFAESGIMTRAKGSRMEIIGLRADGTEFPLESTVAKVTTGGETLYTAILRDIGERRRAESELKESHRQLRELASSLQEVREEERTSIARELHDELGQQLLRLRMDLSWLAGRMKDLSPALQEKVDEMKHFVEGTVDAVRRVTTQLRPPLLDDLGLAEAARWQLDEFAQRTGIEVVSTIVMDDEALSERVAINVFRILQESLTNVARHAGATQVSVSLATAEDGLTLEIRDNGSGNELRDNPELGHGLVGIRERTLLLGGQMEIASAPGEGFALSVKIPLAVPESTGEQK